MGAPLGWAAAQQLRLGARRSGAGQEDGGGLGQEEGRRRRDGGIGVTRHDRV